jgi:RNA polymerase sigma-70 factor (ECF subfamily)
VTEQQLLAALRDRDPEAFAFLFDTYSDRVYRLAAGLLADDDEAEGVVQETFLRLFERLDSFEGRSTLGTWLYRVAYNLSMDRLRRRRPTLSLDGDGEDSLPEVTNLADWRDAPERFLSAEEMSAELGRAIAALPETLRAVFMLREVEGLATDECAQVLGITAGAVKVRLHRARLLLRERLAATFAEQA